MECEVCGEDGACFFCLIGGARLWCCPDCAKSGKVIERARTAPKAQQKPQRPELEVVPDYAERIKGARERMKIDRSVLAELVSEKESFIERIEKGKTLPGEALCAKLEKALGVKLLEEVGASVSFGKQAKEKEVTLGDIVTVKKKR